jgi:hypothetical protein
VRPRFSIALLSEDKSERSWRGLRAISGASIAAATSRTRSRLLLEQPERSRTVATEAQAVSVCRVIELSVPR